MTLTDAQAQALPGLLAQIAALKAQLAIAQQLAADSSATFTGTFGVQSSATGSLNMTIEPLSNAESAPFFQAAVTLLQNRLAAAQQTLAAL